MPIYYYRAKSLEGEEKTGELEAENEFELAKLLYDQGFLLISATTERRKKGSHFSFSLGRISLKDKLMFTRNLQVMIKAGISLPRALETLSVQTRNKKFQKILLRLAHDIQKGESFSDALEKNPKIFSPLFCHMVRVGEESGTLEEILQNLALQMEKTADLKSKVKSALIYPAVIISVMILIAGLMLVMVVPKLSKIFEDLNMQLPMTTQVVIGMGNFLSKNIFLVIIALFGLGFLFYFSLRTNTGKKAKDTILLKIPVISSLIKKINASYTVRNLSILTRSGVSLLKSLDIVAGVLPNVYFKEAILKAKETVRKGGKLSEGLADFKEIFPPTVLEMIKVGEETGETSRILEELADFFEEEVGVTTKNLVSLIEPLLMVLIGAVVGFFAISMIQPIYSMVGSF